LLNLASEKKPAPFPFYYRTFLQKFYPEEMGLITNINATGNSPVISNQEDLLTCLLLLCSIFTVHSVVHVVATQSCQLSLPCDHENWGLLCTGVEEQLQPILCVGHLLLLLLLLLKLVAHPN